MAAAFERSNRFERSLPVLGSALGVIIGLIVLASYTIGFEPGWRPIQDLPGTHPVTALCLILLGCGFWVTGRSPLTPRLLAQAGIAVVVVAALAKIADASFGTQMIAHVTPFGRTLAAQAAAGRAVRFSPNSAIALLGIGLGQALLLHRQVKASQIVLACATAVIAVAFIGYLDGLHTFHQSMAPLTLLACAALAAAGLATRASDGFMAVLIRDTEPGRFARLLLVSSTIVILVVGCLVARHIDAGDGAILAYQTVALLAWTWIVVTASTIRADAIDRLRREANAALLRDATTDALTGLLNRNKLDQVLAEPRPDPARTAMITIDVDRFRSANNALGTELGDSLLAQVAARLAAVGQPHIVARAGGDEFVIFCDSIDAAEAMHLGEAVVVAMAVPFTLGPREFRVTTSVGVAHGRTDSTTDLRDAADEAMFIAKQQGGNQAVAFVKALHDARMERVGIEQDLHRALKSDREISLVYQPIISLRDRSVVALEVLARWTHPEMGPIPPGRFIAVAEDSGLFMELGRKLRQLAIAQAAEWQGKRVARMPIINLNVSPLELARSDVPEELTALIEQHGLRTGSFCLEVTEGSFSDEHALAALRDARRRGFRIAMDDFGVGYSSLAQLPRLPLSSVKLDRSFLERAMENEDGLSLLATIVQLSHVLKLPVVAEGVETLEELDIVSACGCDSVQGFIFSRPLTAARLEPFLLNNRPWPTEQPAIAAN